MSAVHVPVIPEWTCAACAAEWPCHTRRLQLRAEFDRAPVSMSIYLASCMISAAEHLPTVPAGVLHARFLGWIPRS